MTASEEVFMSTFTPTWTLAGEDFHLPVHYSLSSEKETATV